LASNNQAWNAWNNRSIQDFTELKRKMSNSNDLNENVKMKVWSANT